MFVLIAAASSLNTRVLAQEPTLPPCVVAHDSAGSPQFYDEPQFTVAGVTDASQMGGHGSDTVRRSTEALTKEAVALSGGPNDVPNKETTDDEKSLRAALVKAPDDAGLHHALADVEEKKGDALAAVKEYQRAAELNPNEIHLFDWGAELLLHRAYEPAAEVFGKGRRVFPVSVRMAVGLGVATYAFGSNELAAQRLCEASDLDPADARPYMFLGKLQGVDSAGVPGVVERLARFARLQPDNAWASYYYALALWRGKETQEGASARVKGLLEKALRVDPKLGLAYLQLGVMRVEEKDYRGAVEEYRKALEVDPEMEEAHFRLANAYRMKGEADKARVELDIYKHISKSNNEIASSTRREIVQFVYSTKVAASAPGHGPPKP